MMVERKSETAAADLTVLERVLLFCVASGTDWRKVGITGATITTKVVKGLIDRGAAGGLPIRPVLGMDQGTKSGEHSGVARV